MARQYYSVRSGRPGVAKLDLDQARRLFLSTFTSLDERGHFQQAMGYYCVDAHDVDGTIGSDIGAFFLRKLRKDHLWPLKEKIDGFSRDDLFDVIELLHDQVSHPVDGRYHSFSNCGWHYETFDQTKGREVFRAEINEFLVDFDEGYELSATGEIQFTGGEGLRELLEAPLPEGSDPKKVDQRVRAAVRKFRGRHSTMDDRRDAVRDLVGVLEFLRPQVNAVLSNSDEADLFNMANNFGIRHHNKLQKDGYDPEWLSWLFYHYLSAIHTVTRLMGKRTDR